MPSYLRLSLTALIFSLSFTDSAQAQNTPLSLFSQHEINSNYDHIVDHIQPGDRLQFSDGHIYTVDHILGEGESNLVMSIRENLNLALRIARNEDVLHSIEAYNQGHALLQSSHIPTVEVFTPGNKEYALVRKLKGPWVTFYDFIEATSKSRQTPKGAVTEPYPTNELCSNFIDFAEKIALFVTVDDMHFDNLVYDLQEKRWLLIDWWSKHEVWNTRQHANQRFDRVNPMSLLTETYGSFFDTQFHPADSRYNWFKPTLQTAAQRIQQIRAQPFATLRCQGAL